MSSQVVALILRESPAVNGHAETRPDNADKADPKGVGRVGGFMVPCRARARR